MFKNFCVFIYILVITGCSPIGSVQQNQTEVNEEVDELSSFRKSISARCVETSYNYVQGQESGLTSEKLIILSGELLEKGYGSGRNEIALTLKEKAELAGGADRLTNDQVDNFIGHYEGCMIDEMDEFYRLQGMTLPEHPETTNNVWGSDIHQRSGKKVANQTDRIGRLKTYDVCVTIPKNGLMIKDSVKTQVIAGVPAGREGDWHNGYEYSENNSYGPGKVCRKFDHRIYDQDRLLVISVNYKLIYQPTGQPTN